MQRTIKRGAIALLILLGISLLLRAQTDSLVLVSPDAVPAIGTFWSMQNMLPPSPFDPFPQLSIYTDGAGNYYYDDRGLDRSQLMGILHSMDDGVPMPGVIVTGGDTNDSGSGWSYALPTYTITTNYNEYTNFWLSITNDSTNACVSVMNTLPGFSYTVLTNSNLSGTNWGEFYTFTATNSISPCPPVSLDAVQLFFNAKLGLGGQSLWVCTNVTPEQIVLWLMGTNPVTVTNITYTGSGLAIGIFTNAAMVGASNGLPGLAFDRGIILSTGWVTNALGPNSDDGGNGWVEGDDESVTPSDLAQYGVDYTDSDLNGLVSGSGINDSAVLEFDIIATNSFQLRFDYIFASEEYPEWIGQFNDPFAIFVSTNFALVAPPFYYAWQNGLSNDIALVPGTNLVVSVNNINGGCTDSAISNSVVQATNAQYYIDNHDPSNSALSPYAAPFAVYNLQYDGFTVPLVAQTNITAGITNHIQIAIGDCYDYIYDSAVFIKASIPENVSCSDL